MSTPPNGTALTHEQATVLQKLVWTSSKTTPAMRLFLVSKILLVLLTVSQTLAADSAPRAL